MTGRAVPSAVRRLSRDRSRVIAVVLLAVVALSASGIQSAAAIVLQQTLDANWRGAYEILVTAKDAATDVDGLLLPNSLGNAQHSLTLNDVEKIRALDGVGVAAPVGEVIVPGFKLSTIKMMLATAAAHASEAPQAFRLTTTFTTDDGLGTRVVSENNQNIVIDQSVEAGSLKSVTTEPGAAAPANGIWGINGDSISRPDNTSSSTWSFDLNRGTPSATAHITLIDPVAEKELLGKAGAFLDPLVKLKPSGSTTSAQLLDWANSTDNRYAKSFLSSQIVIGDSPTQPAAPVLISSQPSTDLTMQLTVESFGTASPNPDSDGFNSPYLLPQALTRGDTGKLVGTSTSDVSALLNPFVSTEASIAWPGTMLDKTTPSGSSSALLFQAVGVSTPGRTSRAAGQGYELSAKGFKDPSPDYANWPASAFALSKDGEKPGFESTYIGTRMLANNKNSTLAVPVGDFSDSSAINTQSSLSYVPLGAYEPVASTTDTGATLKPNVTGLGIVGARTTAIASIYSAGAWGQIAPVNAVRVRVSGISSFTAAARSKVIAVTQAIQNLGLKATIAAGSSPTNVKLGVADYAFGVSSVEKTQKVGRLGQLTQQWSELGAAARADIAVSTASLSVLGIALGSTALLLGAVQFASIPRRRGQAAVMREIGWTRGHIRRWMFAEEIPGALIVLAAGLVAVSLSGLQQVSILIAAIGVAVVVLTSVVAVVFGARGPARAVRVRESGGRRMLRLRGRSTRTFGLRQARIHLLTSITQVVAVLIVALSTAGLADAFLEGRRQAGASLLAQFTTGQAALFQVVLGTVALASGIILAVLARRLDLARRSPQWAALRAMGWTAPELRSAQRMEAATVAIPAILLATAATYGGAQLLGSTATIPLLITGAGAAIVASLTLLFVRRKATAQ